LSEILIEDAHIHKLPENTISISNQLLEPNFRGSLDKMLKEKANNQASFEVYFLNFECLYLTNSS